MAKNRVAVEVARVEGAMIGYGWKSRFSPYPDGYTDKYFKESQIFMQPPEGPLHEVSVALQGIIEDLPNLRKYVRTERAKILKQLKKG